MKSELIDTPYQGLRPFKEQDQAYFFGREQETREIIASLLTTRLTFFFGSCGVGKTSFLNAGVMALLHKQTRTPLTRDLSFKRAIIYFNHWASQGEISKKNNGLFALKRDIKTELIKVLAQSPNVDALSETEKLKESLRSVLGDVLEEKSPKDLDTSANLISLLTSAAKLLDGHVIILLDQFEKYLSQTGTEEEIQRRDKELIEAINHADPRVRFLISIREENLQQLDRLRKKIPQFFTSTYRLNPLSLSQARDAIQKPLEIHHQIFPTKGPVHTDPSFVEGILEDLPRLDPSWPSYLKDFHYREITRAEVGIEASYLQLVLSYLWEVAVKQNRKKLGLTLYKNLGGITSILSAQVQSAIDRQEESKILAKKLSLQLITSDGETYKMSESALAETCKTTSDKISKILTQFVDKERILRPLSDGGFILFQERLAPILLEHRKAYEKNLEDAARRQQLLRSKKQAKKAIKSVRRFQYLSISLTVILIVSLGATLFAFKQEKQAEQRVQVAASKTEAAKNAKKQAELKRQKAERKRKQTEQQLTLASAKAKKAEVARQKAEAKRKQTEQRLALVSAKAKKIEVARQKAEAKRKQTEQQLALASAKAKKTEIARQKAEAKRKQTEQRLALASAKAKKQAVPVSQKRPVTSQPRLGLNSEQQLALMLKATPRPFTLDGSLGVKIDQLIKRSSSLSEKVTLKGHAMKINSVAFSPDGLKIATASTDKKAIVWDAKTGKSLSFLEGHTRGVNAVAFSPNDSKIATGSSDFTTKIWDFQSGEVLDTLKGHTDAVNDVIFDPTGKRVITASQDKTARIWDIQSKKTLYILSGHTGVIKHLAVSPDGKKIATASDDKTAKIWDEKGLNLLTLKGHSGSVNGIAFSPNGKQVATVSTDKTARLWNTKTGKPLLIFKGHRSTITSVAFSPNGKWLATTSWDKTTKIWDAHSAKLISSIRGHRSFVNSVAFSPNGKQLVTASLDKTAKIWDQPSQSALFSLNDPSDKVTGVTFSPDGKWIVTTDPGRSAKIWDADSGKMLLTLQGHTQRITSVAFSPDATRISTASEDKTSKIWDARTGKMLLTLKGHSKAVTDIAFSPSGRFLASTSNDKTTIIWYVKSGEVRAKFSGHKGDVVAVAFSPDGKQIATSSTDQTAKTWEIASGKIVHTFRGHTGAVTGIAFSRDGKQIATTSADKASKIWDTVSGKGLTPIRRLGSFINGIAFSNTGRRIVTADANKHIQVYAMNLKELVALAKNTVSSKNK